MRAISILYHDVICNQDFDASGFAGPGAAVYKLQQAQFGEHLAKIAEAILAAPVTVLDLLAGNEHRDPFLLTFDDGGVSAVSPIAAQLGQYGWVGHFFITANRIGSSTFVSKEQIRELHKRGHIIGSHSYSHPPRMSKCSWGMLVKEWSTSIQILSDILGEQVRVASVPGGYYSTRVAKAAASEGVRALFTSEPTTRSHFVDGCLVLGRCSVRRDTPTSVAAAYASGTLTPRMGNGYFGTR